MENKEVVHQAQTPSSNPIRLTTLSENYSSFVPENNSGFLFPEINPAFLPEIYPTFGFLPENNQPTPYPAFESSWLNPSRQLNPTSYDWDSSSLDEYFDRLNLSTPHHRSVGPTDPVLRSRAQSAVRGLHDNLYSGMYSQEAGFAYEDGRNVFMGRPESVFRSNHRVNGPMFESEPGVNQSGLVWENRFRSNGLNAQNGAFYMNNRVSGLSSSRDGLILDPLNWTSRPNHVRTEPTRSNWASGSQLFSSRSIEDRARPTRQELSWAGPMSVRSNRANNGPGTEYANHSVKDFRGKIKLMAKNRDGSAFLKKKLEEGVEEDIVMVFEELKDDVVGLMVNYFGNTVVQKLFKGCGPEQISYMLNLLLREKHKFVEICYDNHGTLAMEKFLQNLTTPNQRNSVISFLRGLVLSLSKDQNGHKVVQYCIGHFPDNVDVLINELAKDCYGIATHKSGCVVLQECLGRAVGDTMERLMAELGPNLLILAEHPYGNYVVQYIIEKKNPRITKIVLNWLEGNYVSLSMNKCSSNVVEKCLVFTIEDEATEIIAEIMNSDNFKMVIQDMYGNYVVQKALEVSENMQQSDIYLRLKNRIKSLHGSLNSHPFGNRVLSKLNHRPKLN